MGKGEKSCHAVVRPLPASQFVMHDNVSRLNGK